MSTPAAPDANKLEEIKARLLEDPNTEKIAATLGVPVSQYMDLVLKYARNPGQRAMVAAIPDEMLRSVGVHPPSVEEVGQLMQESLEKAVAVTEKVNKTAYDEKGKAAPQVLNPQTEGLGTSDERTSSEAARKLKEEMDKKLKGTKY